MRLAVRWLMRGALLALLALAWMNPSLPESGPRRRVYLVDASASTSRSSSTDAFTPEDALRLAAHDASRLDPHDQVALVAFGAKPVILFPLTQASRVRIPPRLDGVDGSSTDLPAALEMAAAMAEGGEIVLFSDGRSTAGRVPVERIKAPVHAFPLGPIGGVDVSIAAIDAPATAAAGASIDIRVTVESTGAWHGALAGKPLDFTGPGQQDIVMTTTNRTVDLRLEGPPDACPENDAATVTVFTETQEPRMLIVSSSPSGLAKLFPGARVAPDLAAVAEADVVVIERLRADESNRADLERLAGLVERGGAGLVMLGGSSAFALGGWGGTPVEGLLPFWAWPDDRSAVVVALDRSGSMSEPAPGRTRPRLEEAVNAVRRALQLAHPDDELALVTFADSAELRCPLVKGSDRGRAAAALQNLSSGGGTVLSKALDLAAATAKSSQAGRRRIVLVTDGRSEKSEEAELRNAAARIRDEGIGLTVVRIGDKTPALDVLWVMGAEELDGSDFAQIDARLAEALARSRELTLVPVQGLEGLQDGAKPGRVNRASLKPGSQSWARIGSLHVAAFRTAGRGRVAATALSFESGWIGDLDGALVTRLVDAVAPPASRLPAEIALRFEDDRLTISAAALGADRPEKFEITVDGATHVLSRRAENAYEKTIRLDQGSAVIRLDGRVAAVARRPHPVEFARVGPDLDGLSHLAQVTGGSMIQSPNELGTLPGRRVGRPRSARPLLLGAALVLFLLEIAAALIPPRAAARRPAGR